MRPMSWSEPELEFAKLAYGDSMSFSQIAEAMAKRFGIVRSRGAVAGMLSRQGVLTRRATASAARKEKKKVARVAAPVVKPKPKPAPKPIPVGPVLSPDAQHWTSRRFGQCAFLVDDRGTACCNPVHGGETKMQITYCAGHYAKMTTAVHYPMTPRRQEMLARTFAPRERAPAPSSEIMGAWV